MSFNFGNQSTLGTTSTPAKPAFGNFSFGAATTAAPAFGATATATPSFGGFGQQQQPAAAPPAFGAAPAQTSVFGATPAAAAPTFGGFGAQSAAATSTTGFGTFGTAASAAPAFGGFGTTNTQTSTGLTGFGTGTTGFGGFGATATTSAPLFGGFNTSTNTGFGGGGGFGTQFGQKPATSTFGAFGGTGFGQNLQQPQQQQQQQAPPLNADEAFTHSIFKVSIFGDERDTTIARWNYLQAMWGIGKSFYSQSAAPIDINTSNYLCRFKAMGYSKLPGKDNKMGMVALVFNKPHSQVKEQQQQIVTGITQALGNKPNLTISVDNCVSLSDNKSQLVIYVDDKAPNSNETKRILATELGNFLNQPMIKQNLVNMGLDQILPMVLPDEDQLKEYLENPPKGIDPRMWKQAKSDNPDPAKFIPVPMIGFSELRWRIKCQENEIESHTQYLSKVEKDINELKQRHANTTAKIMEHRRKLSDLSHRILKIVVKQESTRKMGVALSPEEETLRSKLENMQALVSAPTQFKGRLSELLSQMRMQRNLWTHGGSSNEYTLDRESSEEMKAFLGMQQKAMALLIDSVNKDTKSLKIISDGMSQLMRGNV